MKQLNLILALLLLTCAASAQKQASIWQLYNGLGLDFNFSPPIKTTGGGLTSGEGNASICDSAGRLLFYSNGEQAYNRNNQVLFNGGGLSGNRSSTTAAFIIPMPGSDSLFYLFTTDGMENELRNGLRYSIVDMCLANGRGGIIAGKKNILLLDTVSEKMTAVNHANGRDIWLITHKYRSDAFYAYLITATGISTPIISHIGSVHQQPSGLEYAAIGQMKASANGTRLAVAFSNLDPSVLELFDFYKSTGIVNNVRSLNVGNVAYSVEFSPNSSKLYAEGQHKIYQYDLSAGDPVDISDSRRVIADTYGRLQLGPDDKIYVLTPGATYIGVINNPDYFGSSAQYVAQQINMVPHQLGGNFPSFINSFVYRNGGAVCPDGIPPLYMAIQAQNSCNSTCNGTAIATGIDGVAPYGYVWSNGTQGAIANNLCAGTYTVTVTDSDGGNVVRQITITEQQAPTTALPASNATICPSDSLQLCATGIALSYTWSNGQTGQCIYAQQAGTYYVTATNGVECSATAVTTVSTFPPSPISVTIAGDTLRAQGGNTYQWYLNGQAIAGATQTEYIATQTGDYTVLITDDNACPAVSNTIPLSVTGVENINADAAGVQLYPNPSHNGTWQLAASAQWLGSNYTIYNVNGRLIAQGNVTQTNTALAIDNAKGLYLLRIQNTTRSTTLKLVAY